MKPYYSDMRARAREARLEEKFRHAMYRCEGCGAPILVKDENFRFTTKQMVFETDEILITCTYCGTSAVVKKIDYETMRWA